MTQNEILALAFVAFFVLLILFIVFASKNKRLREAEGDEGYKVRVKLIKKHNFVDYFAYLFIVSFGGSFLGAYIGFLGIFQTIIIISLLVLLFTPLDHWIHLHFLKKSKLREQKQNE